MCEWVPTWQLITICNSSPKISDLHVGNSHMNIKINISYLITTTTLKNVLCFYFINEFNQLDQGVGEMAQRLRALAALIEFLAPTTQDST